MLSLPHLSSLCHQLLAPRHSTESLHSQSPSRILSGLHLQKISHHRPFHTKTHLELFFHRLSHQQPWQPQTLSKIIKSSAISSSHPHLRVLVTLSSSHLRRDPSLARGKQYTGLASQSLRPQTLALAIESTSLVSRVSPVPPCRRQQSLQR